jgi:hypothetical protein
MLLLSEFTFPDRKLKVGYADRIWDVIYKTPINQIKQSYKNNGGMFSMNFSIDPSYTSQPTHHKTFYICIYNEDLI